MQIRYKEEADLLDHYDSNLSYESPFKRNNSKKFIMNNFLLKKHEINSILDIGCGDGRFARGYDDPDVKIDGVDFSIKRIEKARQLNKNKNVRFFHQDVYEYVDTCKQKYDLIVIVEVLEHLQHPDLLIKGAKKLLTPGGRIIGTVPINMPYKAHLQVYKSISDVHAGLSPKIAVARQGLFLCQWDASK